MPGLVQANDGEPEPLERLRPPTTTAALCALGILAGCQSYERRPLDLAAHREAWHARTLDRETLADFLERLEEASADGELDLADGVSLHEGQLVALVFNPELRLARLRVARSAAGAEHAGRWSDPRLELDILRITESVPDPWVITSGLAFSIPLSGQLEAERRVAAAELGASEGALLEAEWSVWRDVRAAWIEWSAARLRVDETERFVADMEGLVHTASELAERGEIPRTEASLFRVEESLRQNELRRLVGEADALEQRLRSLLGLAPTAPAELVPAIASNTAVEEGAAGPRAIELRNPGLARLRREYEVAEETLRREIREQGPDLTLGPLFESDEGQSRIGLLGAIPIPLLNANRRAIAEARAEREIARATVETTYELLVGRWAAATARARSLASQREHLEQVLVPLVDRQLEDAFELLRLGEGTSLVLLESLTRALRTKLELIDTRSAEALARTEAAYLIGPEPNEEPPGAADENR